MATDISRYNGAGAANFILGNANAISTGGLEMDGGSLVMNGQNISVANLSSTAFGVGSGLVLSLGAINTTAGNNWIGATTVSGISTGNAISGAEVPPNTYISGTATTTEAPTATGTVNTSTITVSSNTGLAANRSHHRNRHSHRHYHSAGTSLARQSQSAIH